MVDEDKQLEPIDPDVDIPQLIIRRDAVDGEAVTTFEHPNYIGADYTKLQKQAAVQAYAYYPSKSMAAQQAGVSRRTIHRWLNDDIIFREAMETAKESAVGGLERMAMLRAEEGSDTMIQFLLKANDPKYQDQKRYHVDGEVRHRRVEEMSDDEVKKEEAQLAAELGLDPSQIEDAEFEEVEDEGENVPQDP